MSISTEHTLVWSETWEPFCRKKQSNKQKHEVMDDKRKALAHKEGRERKRRKRGRGGQWREGRRNKVGSKVRQGEKKGGKKKGRNEVTRSK